MLRFVIGGSLILASSLYAATDSAPNWNPKQAAAYLDGRSEWWMSWPNAARDHGTFCVSCHTAAPYAISRLALRSALGEQGPSALESKLVANVTKRVQMWGEVEPFYKDGKSGPTKSAESRGTEAVLNALILATYNSSDAGLAFENMWKEQYREARRRGRSRGSTSRIAVGGGRLTLLRGVACRDCFERGDGEVSRAACDSRPVSGVNRLSAEQFRSAVVGQSASGIVGERKATRFSDVGSEEGRGGANLVGAADRWRLEFDVASG